MNPADQDLNRSVIPEQGDRPGFECSRSSPTRAGLIASGLFAILALGLILSRYDTGRAAWDAKHFHEPTVRTFAEQLPSPDLSDYGAAATPLYHLLLAVPVRIGETLGSGTSLRLMSAGISAVMIFLLASALARRSSTRLGVLLTLPMIASMYVLLPGVFVSPDNLAWLLVLTLLLRSLATDRTSPGSMVVSGLLLMLLVSTRQIHLWAAAPLAVAAWLSTDDEINRSVVSGLKNRIKPTSLMLLVTLPAVLIVGWFVWLWSGLTPPRFQNVNQSLSPALPAFILLEIAVLSVFLVPWLWPVWRGLSARTRLMMLLGGGLVGVLLATVPETTWSFEQGRASGWWNAVRRLPVIADHSSIVLLLGAPAGAVCVLVWGAGLCRRERWILGTTLLAFAASQAASANVWQRYHEPLLLMLIGLAAASIRPIGGMPNWNAARRWAPVVMAAFLGLITAQAIRAGDRNPDKQRPDVFGVTPSASSDNATTPENQTQTEPEASDGP